VARIPDCAAGAITRIALWDASSRAYWEVAGPPTPLTSFVVGVAPEGFTEVTRYRDPPPAAVLRLVAWRRDGGPIGIRYRANDLVDNRVVALTPLHRFTISGFQTARVCGERESDVDTTTTSTTLPAEVGITSTTADTIVADPADPDGTGTTEPTPGSTAPDQTTDPDQTTPDQTNPDQTTTTG
jgi:hypothetical protein